MTWYCTALILDHEKLFCACGNHRFIRVSCTIDTRTGKTFFYEGRLPTSTKGLRYNVSTKKKNKFDLGLLLGEGQLLDNAWKHKLRSHQRQQQQQPLFGDTILQSMGISPKTLMQKNIVIGHGNKNPNAEKGRERRGKKKSSK